MNKTIGRFFVPLLYVLCTLQAQAKDSNQHQQLLSQPFSEWSELSKEEKHGAVEIALKNFLKSSKRIGRKNVFATHTSALRVKPLTTVGMEEIKNYGAAHSANIIVHLMDVAREDADTRNSKELDNMPIIDCITNRMRFRGHMTGEYIPYSD